MKPNLGKLQKPSRKRPVLLRDDERYRLLFGPYEPPVVKRGFLVDAVRGKLPFGQFSNALIPWPKAKKRGKGGSGGYILCGDLLRALANESAPAISYHWGVSRATVGSWRRALEMKELTAGAQRLVSLGVELARLPQSRKKLSDAVRGRKISARHKAKLHGAMQRGWRERFKARRATYLKTGYFPTATKSDPWIPEEEKLLSRFTTAELAKILGRTVKSIHAHRNLLGIRTRVYQKRVWKKHELKLLGTASDREIAERLGLSTNSVKAKRRSLGIQSVGYRFWTATDEAIIGKVPDAEAARRLGRTLKSIQHHRRKLGMAFFRVTNRRKWSAADEALLGTDTDVKIAERLGVTPTAVAIHRRKKRIAVKMVNTPWTSEELAVLGTMSDIEAARKLNRSLNSVRSKRFKLKVPPGFNRRWSRSEQDLLGTIRDEKLAEKLGRTVAAVRTQRKKLHIPASGIDNRCP